MARRILFLLLFCLGVAEMTQAQSFYNIRRNRNFMVNFGSGMAAYKGELVNPGQLGSSRANLSIGAEYYLKPRISVRAQMTWFQTTGNDAQANDDRWQRNLSFKSNNYEFSAIGILNLGPQGGRYYERPMLNLHGFIGIGVFYFNPTTKLDGEKYALQPMKTEGVSYSRVQPAVPIGLGARLQISPTMNLLVEGGYRFTLTDYLDDVSSDRYPGLEALGLNGMPAEEAYQTIQFRLSDRRYEIGTEPGPPFPDVNEEARTTQGRRGNPTENDGYFILNISLQYYLPTEIFRGGQRKLYTVKRKAYYRKPSKRR